jgi:hypothetical protein
MNTDIILGIIHAAAGAMGYLALWKMRKRRQRLNAMARQQAARHNDYLSSLKFS